VFSPYYAAARRRGAGDPLDHVSVNAILYTARGKYWAMTERGKGSLERSASRLAIGPSTLSWDGSRLTMDIDEWTMPLPRRLRGRVTLDTGPIFGEAHALDTAGRHRWRPIAPCATASVAFEKPALAWQGQAYIDMNFGSEPLEEGFRYWTWSRQSQAAATRILYDVVQRDGARRHLALDYGRGGKVGRFTPPPVLALPRTGWQVARATRADPGNPVRVARTLEDTPFYSRSLLEGGDDGAQWIHESVDLDRFRSRWVQALLPFKMPRRGR